MRMRWWLAIVLSCCVLVPAQAMEEMRDAWRSPFGAVRDVASDPRDHSCWVATGASIMHLSPAGTTLSQWNGFGALESIALDPTDGSIWVGDWVAGAVIRLSADGTEQWRRGGFREPCSLSLDPTDGSCWVADGGVWDPTTWDTIVDAKVVHLSAGGGELWRSSTFEVPWGVAVNPNDRSVWVADIGNWDSWSQQFVGGSVAHLAAGGSELWRSTSFLGPIWVSVNPNDNSVWVADRGLATDVAFTSGAVAHLKADGTQLWRGSPVSSATRVMVDPNDNSCWVGDYWNDELVHLSESGATTWSDYEYGSGGIAINSDDHSCWVAGFRSVVHLGADGTELWRGQNMFDPWSVSVYPGNGSCWVGDSGSLVRLSASGTTLWRSAVDDYCCAHSVSVDASDGSVWVAALALPGVAHVTASGSEQFFYSGVDSPAAVSAAADSVWIADWNSVLHVSADGTTLWKGTTFSYPTGVSWNSDDASVWVADLGADQIIHLSGSGGELWRGNNFPYAYAVSANPNDGSCWAVDAGRTAPTPQAVHLSQDGTELWRGGDFVNLWAVSVDPSDDSCWVADDSGVAHYAADGTLLWRGYSFYWAESVSANPSDGSVWVADNGNAQVVHLVPGPPRAGFTASPTGGAVPLTVQFTDTSSGNPSSWSWTFGDGGTATAQHPTYQYTQVGTYDVGLTATNGIGPGTVTKPKLILVTFGDVPATGEPHWALHQILACVDAGIVQGYADGTYGPTLPVDRASMAVYISRALAGGDANVHVPTGLTEPSFTDVGAEQWAYRYIEYAASSAANVVQGYSDGTYKPDDLVNRGQMAVYVARAMVSPTGDAAVPDPPATPTFSDVGPEGDWGWCYRHVEYCVAAGVVQGYSDGTYHPETVVTRDQMAVYIQRAFELPM